MVFLLGIHGGPQFRAMRIRFFGWVGISVLPVFLPSSLSIFLQPVLVLALPTLLWRGGRRRYVEKT